VWLDRFERVNGQLMVVGITRSGQESLIQPAQMRSSKRGIDAYKAVTLVTSFSQWGDRSAREYANVFGFSSGVTERHRVFSIPHRSGHIVCPAWELQRGLLAGSGSMADLVYRPSGLELLCAPVCAPEEFTVTLLPNRALGRRLHSDSLIERLMWLYAYPSAHRAWNSLYRHARSGMIDIDLPIADIEMSAHGKSVGDVFYARRVYVRQITPRERPFDWAKTDRQSYNFDDGLLRQFRVRQTRDKRLHPVDNCWSLTDDEWIIVEKIVASGGLLTRGGKRTKFDARQIIDGIVIKMGTGMSWV
jgi:hypothetical protein